MVATAKVQGTCMWALLNHMVSYFLHVLEQAAVLIPQGLQAGDGYPWEDQPMVTCFGVFVLDYNYFIILKHLQEEFREYTVIIQP